MCDRMMIRFRTSIADPPRGSHDLKLSYLPDGLNVRLCVRKKTKIHFSSAQFGVFRGRGRYIFRRETDDNLDNLEE